MLVVVALLAGCGGETSRPAPTPVAVDGYGRELFDERVIGSIPGCVTCHSLEPGVTLVGPSLAEVTSPIPGVSTTDYVRESIVDPDAYLVDGFSAGQMTGGWDEYLSDEQINSLVEFLLEAD
jgi:mono/diheme cytochrome c family protein